METINLSITLSVILLSYYLFIGYAYDLFKIGTTYNTPNKLVNELRSKYTVMIKTFQRNTPQLGMSRFKTIYLNENLFKKPDRLLEVFHHEHYHILKKHKLKSLLLRLSIALSPLLINISWILFINVLVALIFITDYYTRERSFKPKREPGVFERNAENYARQMMEINKNR